jgi:hypothetical protein
MGQCFQFDGILAGGYHRDRATFLCLFHQAQRFFGTPCMVIPLGSGPYHPSAGRLEILFDPNRSRDCGEQTHWFTAKPARGNRLFATGDPGKTDDLLG